MTAKRKSPSKGGGTARGGSDTDKYINNQAPEFQKTLRELRTILRNAAPEAVELLSYKIPCLRLKHMLVGFGVTKTSCSLYTMSPELVKSMKDDLRGVKYSGATLHFRLDEKLPEALIRKIVKARIIENRSKQTEHSDALSEPKE